MLAGACRKEDQFTTDPGAMLSFSSDSVLFDTVFQQSGMNKPISVTKQLWVFNPNKEGVKVNISLKGNPYGMYKLNIDGRPGNAIYGKEIRGKDSIMVFIQMYVDNNGANDPTKPFIVTDQLIFETNGNIQDVDIAGYARVAKYLRNEVLDCSTGNMHWTPELPYVIYDSVLVPKGCTLTIDAGTHIYSHARSCFLVAGTLIVNGTPSNPVIFEGDRLEPDYRDVPGQWIGIRMLTPSRDNVIKNAVIKNGIIGVEVDSFSVNQNEKLLITQSTIANMSVYGLAGFTADLVAINNLVTNCGQYTFIGALGGNYQLYHNTFATFATTFDRKTRTFLLDNSPYTNEAEQIIAAFPLSCNMVNNIVYGNQDDEVLLNAKADGGNPSGTLNIQNCLMRTKDYTSVLNINGNILNEDPKFKDALKGDYDLADDSPAKGKGTFINVSNDIRSRSRNTQAPTIGCYE